MKNQQKLQLEDVTDIGWCDQGNLFEIALKNVRDDGEASKQRNDLLSSCLTID